MTTPKQISIRKLAKETGHDRESISKWIDGAKTEEEALALIEQRKGKAAVAAVDPETGLSWWQARLKEDVLRMRHEREVREGLASEELMLTKDHERILKAGITKLELIPSKMQSEAGLNSQQIITLRRMLDDYRNTAADEIEKMGDECDQ